MARPIKQGLDYFPLDTDFFGDFKIQRLLEAFGAKGAAAYLFILCAAYRENGYYVQCDEKFVFNVAFFLRMKETLVNEIIGYCIRVDLFDRGCFDAGRVLTSRGIQKRYLQVCKSRRLKAGITSHNLIAEETVVNAEDTDVSPASTAVSTSSSTQKESKGKEREKEEDVKKNPADGFPPSPADTSVLSSFQQQTDIDTLIDEFKCEQTFRDYCRMQNKLSEEELDGYFEKFRLFLHATDEHTKRRKDCKTHFLNWLRSQAAQNARVSQEEPSPTEEPTDRQVARVLQLYPECNHYAERLYRNYIREHGLKPDVALEHFERAHKNGLTYGNIIYRIQVDHRLLFKN